MTQGYDYEPDSTNSVYLRLKTKGESCKIRIVSTPIHFKDEYQGKARERFAWQVIDRKDNTVKVFTSGTSIYLIIRGLAQSEDWGDPTLYDLTITRTEESTSNFYKVIPSPNKRELTDEEIELVGKANLDIVKLVGKGKGTNTFGEPNQVKPREEMTDKELAMEQVPPEDIPF